MKTGEEYANTDYLSGFQYRSSYTNAQGDQSEATLQYFPHTEGYVQHVGGEFFYIYNYTDHLGNIRLSYTFDYASGLIKIMEENHYYPFGLKHDSYNTNRLGYSSYIDDNEVAYHVLEEKPKFVGDGSYNYKYNGKELQDELGLNMYDYGARNYDPALGRWMNIDPYAFLYFSTSSYAFIHNSPLIKVDPDGMRIIGVTKEDAKKANEDINKIFADKRFDQFRAMISLKGKEFNKIDGEKLKEFLKNSDLSSDDKHLIETVSNTINSDNDHFIEYKKIKENLSTEFVKQLSVDSSVDTSTGIKAGVFGRGGTGITKHTKNGSFSLIIESEGGIGSLFEGANDYVNKEGGREHNPVGRPAIFGHEVFGHGRSYHIGLKTETEQHSEAIKMENLILRVMGNDLQRDGKDHSFSKPVENPSSLPTTK